MEPKPTDALEILSVELLERHRPTANQLRLLARELVLPIGWHYLLDLTWILARTGEVAGREVLDAGAGIGLIQWHLASHGARVLSVDRGDRSRLAWHLRRRYHVTGRERRDLAPVWWTVTSPRELARTLLALWRCHLRFGPTAPGRVVLHRGDLGDLAAVASDSVDLVVSVSALEHNPPGRLPAVVRELARVLRPGGRLIATLAAAADGDWYHQPSKGWCYSEATLRAAFDLSPGVVSNFHRHDDLLAALRANRELREGLASFYRRSGANGMPWGRWDPRYQPVGVCKVKTSTG
jgi:SAM-dependent methyltransferase